MTLHMKLRARNVLNVTVVEIGKRLPHLSALLSAQRRQRFAHGKGPDHFGPGQCPAAYLAKTCLGRNAMPCGYSIFVIFSRI